MSKQSDKASVRKSRRCDWKRVVRVSATGPHVCYAFGKMSSGRCFECKPPTGEAMQGQNKVRFLTAIEPQKRIR
jgi:hypothetical protein